MPRCAECGLLAVTDEYDRSVVSEAVTETRKTGSQPNKDKPSSKARFFCYANSDAYEVTEGKAKETVLVVLSNERACDSFRKYHPGKSPKEHEEMTLMEQMREESAETLAEHLAITERHHQEAMELQKELSELIANTDKKNRADAKDEARRMFSLTILFQFLIALMGVVATLVSVKLIPWFQLPVN